MRENRIENALIRRIETHYAGLCIKIPPIFFKGIPDRLVILPGGRMQFVETKSPVGSLSPAQVRVHDKLIRMGCSVYIINTLDALNDIYPK